MVWLRTVLYNQVKAKENENKIYEFDPKIHSYKFAFEIVESNLLPYLCGIHDTY